MVFEMQRILLSISLVVVLSGSDYAVAQAPIRIDSQVRAARICSGDSAGDSYEFFLRLTVRNVTSARVSITTPVIVMAKVAATSDPDAKPLLAEMPEWFGAAPQRMRRLVLMPQESQPFDLHTSVSVGRSSDVSRIGPGKYWLHLVVAPWVPLIVKTTPNLTVWTDKVDAEPLAFSLPESWVAVSCK